MAKIAVVYWSGTGNTEKMAETFLEEVKAKGCEGELFFANEFSRDNLGDFDGFAFGCPAMGNEALEDGEFEPMFEEVETKLEDKPVAIFGSYEWNDGEWMDIWQDRCKDNGINLAADGVIAYDDPDDEALDRVRALADSLVEKI
ncbi:flavodoxin [Anaerococcus vaginimassiliensis]|uniref:flavodoxin n=1 Tax=Anaerococcus vaginimassiliensis TaxID=2042308 RepID=UPI0010314E87|nr:flavodoxin [Anaerococcus vaginimassiliensis]